MDEMTIDQEFEQLQAEFLGSYVARPKLSIERVGGKSQ